jgi:large subunit ribosomal protein L1
VNREAGIHVPIGKVSFTEEQLLENFYALMGAVIRARPASAKGTYLRRAFVSSTMGPGIRLNTQEAASVN